jgi:hypothetical protein
MNNSLRLLGLCVWALLWAHSALALSQLSAVGSKFFDEEGKQFFVKGIAYQLTPYDPLINTRQCELDSALMKELGANAIRVYHVDVRIRSRPKLNSGNKPLTSSLIIAERRPCRLHEGI